MARLRPGTAVRCSVLVIIALGSGLPAQERTAPDRPAPGPRMSTAGELARRRVVETIRGRTIESGGCMNEPDCEDEAVIAPALQAETSIAVDATGQHVVVGFNDGRGFSSNPFSVSGFMYSDDGGRTFTDGGQLPTPGTDVVGDRRLPEVYGDPDVKYAGACTFLYSSIGVTKISSGGLAQGLVIHRSTDCGHTWSGPFDVPPAINPNGDLDPAGNANDAADKELTDIDPDTGRYMICWTNFAKTGREMSCTYSDDILSATPTFAPRSVVGARPVDGQGSAVRFAGNGSANVVVAWTSFSGLANRTSFARSTDNGQTWSAAAYLSPPFFTMDQVLGNDRVNTFPSVAIDTSSGPFGGSVYVVYANNDRRDGADVMLQRSSDGGLIFTAPVAINSRPGGDRAQWLPYVTVDKTTGRATVFYYDQGVDTSGHRTEVTYTFSDDGGLNWSAPQALSDRPFKAGWGNDTTQPNLGDYNQAVAQSGSVYASYAVTRQVGFTDGQPSFSLTTPDVEVKAFQPLARPPVRIETPSVTDGGGNGSLDPGEQAQLSVPLTNYVTNALNAATLSGLTATLSSTTPGVTVLQPTSAYPMLTPGSSASNLAPFVLQIAPSVTPGTLIDLSLAVQTTGAPVTLALTIPTGTRLFTTLLSENFDGVGPGTLPAGWVPAHGRGANTVPWTTTNAFAPTLCGASNQAFHPNLNDAPGSNQGRWEMLFGPTVTVPAVSQFVSVDFDVCYDTEDDPSFRVLAYDGFFLNVADVTPGRTARTPLAEAIEQDFTTGSFKHYPKHFPRSSNPSYFEDMSVWAGASGGVQHVHLEFPGMAGSQFRLRFDYAQDEFGICSDVRPGRECGVSFDNLVVRNVVAAAQPTVTLAIGQSLARDLAANEILATISVTNNGSAPASNVALTSVSLGAAAPSTPLPVLGTIAPGATVTTVVRFPGTAGAAGSPSVLRIQAGYDGGSAGGTFRVVVP